MNDPRYKPLQENDLVNAAVTELTPIPAGSNPYHHDSLRSGIGLPKGWELMYESGKPGALTELILVNHFTGQRLRLAFEPKHPQLADIIQADKRRDVRYVSGSIYLPDVQGDGSIRWECCDDIDVGDMVSSLYTLWWGEQGLYYVKASLFLDTEAFPKAWMYETVDASFDPNRLYADDVSKLKTVLAEYDLGKGPAAVKGVTVKPIGLND